MENHEDLCLREHDVAPTREIIEQVLKSSYTAYEIFQDKLPELEIEQNWQWYTPHKVWCAKGQYFWTSSRGTKKEKNLYWLHVFEGYFSVAVWFKESNRVELLDTNVSEKTKQIIINAKAEMGLSTFPVVLNVATTEMLADIYKLIECKKRLEAK